MVSDRWMMYSDKHHVLRRKGMALSDVRECLRACIEVGVRDWGNVEKAKGEWRETVEKGLAELGCLENAWSRRRRLRESSSESLDARD